MLEKVIVFLDIYIIMWIPTFVDCHDDFTTFGLCELLRCCLLFFCWETSVRLSHQNPEDGKFSQAQIQSEKKKLEKCTMRCMRSFYLNFYWFKFERKVYGPVQQMCLGCYIPSISRKTHTNSGMDRNFAYCCWKLKPINNSVLDSLLLKRLEASK